MEELKSVQLNKPVEFGKYTMDSNLFSDYFANKLADALGGFDNAYKTVSAMKQAFYLHNDQGNTLSIDERGALPERVRHEG